MDFPQNASNAENVHMMASSFARSSAAMTKWGLAYMLYEQLTVKAVYSPVMGNFQRFFTIQVRIDENNTLPWFKQSSNKFLYILEEWNVKFDLIRKILSSYLKY